MEVSGQLHATATLPPGKLGASKSRSGFCGEEKNISLSEIRAPAVHPVAHHYTDWAMTVYLASYGQDKWGSIPDRHKSFFSSP
jgi:hypothetical protein